MHISELRVLHSAAGYYIGREFLMDPAYNCWAPYDRQSGYFETREEATEALRAIFKFITEHDEEDELQRLDELNRGPGYEEDYAGWPDM